MNDQITTAVFGESKPRRVLITADTIGGVWTHALDLSRELGRHGVEVVIAAMGGALSRSQAAEASGIRNLIVFESSYKLEWMDEPWGDVDAAGDWLYELKCGLSPDVVHLNSFAHGAINFETPKIVAGHSCVLSWWRAVKCEEAPDNWAAYRSRAAKGILSADRVVAPTRAMLNALDEYYGPIQHGVVIPNGRESRGLRPRSKEEFILSAGRVWDEAKNVKALLDAARLSTWKFVVVGDARHPSTGDIVSGFGPNIELAGQLPSQELADLYGRAAVYALPARYEPFGLSILEAALSGCALILGDIPSLRENWDGAALFVDPDDADMLVEAIDRLMTDEKERCELSGAAIKRSSIFTSYAMGERYLALYSSLLSGERLAHTEVTSCAS